MKENTRRYRVIGERLRMAREQQDLTVEQLAELVGASVKYVESVEAGNRRLTIEWFDRFCEVMKLNRDAVFYGEVRLREPPT